MAKEYVAVVKDDITGEVIEEKDVHSLQFGYMGIWYEIDLGPKTAGEFMDVMNKYVNASTPASDVARTAAARSSRRTTAAPKSDKAELQAAREWLRANGHEVADRGRIKAELMDLYRAAN